MRCGRCRRCEITPKLVRTTVPSSSSTGRSSICAWTDSEKDQKGSKEKMVCSWADSERFLGPGFCLVSGRCSCLSNARVNSAEPSGAHGTCYRGWLFDLTQVGWSADRLASGCMTIAAPSIEAQPWTYRSRAAMRSSRGPRPIHSRCHQTSSYGVEFGVAEGFPEMGVVQRAGVIAPLPHVPARAVYRVPVGGEPAMYMLQAAG